APPRRAAGARRLALGPWILDAGAARGEARRLVLGARRAQSAAKEDSDNVSHIRTRKRRRRELRPAAGRRSVSPGRFHRLPALRSLPAARAQGAARARGALPHRRRAARRLLRAPL